MQYGNFEFIQFSEPKIRENGLKRKRAIFKCSCGDVREYDFTAITTLKTKSCWICSHKKVGASKITHGLVKHPLYKKWADMKKRCHNPNVDRYNAYGALGIEVCDEWRKDFKAFYDWSIKNGWKEGLTIERNDVNGNYCPENCCYIPLADQKYNLKNTFYVEYLGCKIVLKKVVNENGLQKIFSPIWHGIKKANKDIYFYIDKYDGLKEALDLEILNIIKIKE